MEIKPIVKPLSITVFVGSGAPLEGRVALGPAGEPTFGPPRRPIAGFRRLGRRAQVRQKRRNGAMDPDRRKVPCIVAALPRQPQVLDVRACQPELGEKAATTSHVHRSACSGWRTLGVVHPMLCLRKRKVCSRSKRRTYERQMRSRSGVVPSGPCHHSHKTLGFRRLSPRGRRSTSTRTSVPTTMGRGPRLPRPSWFWTFGCSSAHARTRTDP
jgi:hypothetical protein